MLNGHGDDIYNYPNEIVSNFSSNMFAKSDMSALQKHLCSQIGLIHSYPEPDAHSLLSKLADKYGIAENNVCVTNGATEAIYLVAQSFAGSRSALVIPTFSEYEDACRIHSHELIFLENLDEISSQAQLVWLCNPNNPTGYVYDIDYLKKLTNEYLETIFVFDQSYAHFTNTPVWDVREAVQHPNVILLHSMTKQYAIPGLRLGYITAHTDVLTKISERRMPWSVNALAIEAGKFLLNNRLDILHIATYLEEADRLQKELQKIEGLTVLPSDTHFFLCKLENRIAADLKTFLIENYGILIRDAANFRGLNEHFFRVATQSPPENDRLIKAIYEWM